MYEQLIMNFTGFLSMYHVFESVKHVKIVPVRPVQELTV